MALQERLEQLDQKKTNRPGVVQRWLNTLSEEDQKVVLSYMRRSNTELSHHSLLEVLKEEGAPFGKEAFTAFRKELWKTNVSK